MDDSEVPEWLSSLLTEKFFNACVIHENEKKNEKNVFCLDCCDAICPHCLVLHTSHRLLQIRRYIYHDVLRRGDAEKLIDCAQVQSYTSNSTKVVFLNMRPQPKRFRNSGNFCRCCDRNVQDSYLYCSISCKLEHILETGSNLSTYLRTCKILTLPNEPGLDDGQMTPDSVLEQTGSPKTESGSSSIDESVLIDCPILIEIVRKKRSNLAGTRSAFRPVCRPVSEIYQSTSGPTGMNRRKGTPHRSPLY